MFVFISGGSLLRMAIGKCQSFLSNYMLCPLKVYEQCGKFTNTSTLEYINFRKDYQILQQLGQRFRPKDLRFSRIHINEASTITSQIQDILHKYPLGVWQMQSCGSNVHCETCRRQAYKQFCPQNLGEFLYKLNLK